VDLSDLRTIVTTLSFIAFLGVVIWAYNSKQKARFDDAANLPFVDDDEGLKTSRSPGGAHE
jgi:cytochrome c oxidase cbb3-type subunit IV